MFSDGWMQEVAALAIVAAAVLAAARPRSRGPRGQPDGVVLGGRLARGLDRARARRR
jgi:anti-sigma-K factor RskA